MSIVNKIDEVMKNETDAKKIFAMIIELARENNNNVDNTFGVALCSVDYQSRAEFYKELVECYMEYEAKECHILFNSTEFGKVALLKMCIHTFLAHQQNFYFISNLNALNILEKEFIDNKEQYRIAFNECLDFMKEKNIVSSLNVLKTIEVLKF